MYKECLKVLSLWPKLRRPRDLALENLVYGINIIKVWSFGEQKLAPPSKQALGKESIHGKVFEVFHSKLNNHNQLVLYIVQIK